MNDGSGSQHRVAKLFFAWNIQSRRTFFHHHADADRAKRGEAVGAHCAVQTIAHTSSVRGGSTTEADQLLKRPQLMINHIKRLNREWAHPCRHPPGRGTVFMKCPFCAEEVKDEAIVCKHCRHDLTVVRALMQRIEDLTKQLHSIIAERNPHREQSITTVAQGAHISHERAGVIAGAIERHVPLLSPLATVLLASTKSRRPSI